MPTSVLQSVTTYVKASQICVMQEFSNFWCCGAHEEIDHNLRSPTINF